MVTYEWVCARTFFLFLWLRTSWIFDGFHFTLLCYYASMTVSIYLYVRYYIVSHSMCAMVYLAMALVNVCISVLFWFAIAVVRSFVCLLASLIPLSHSLSILSFEAIIWSVCIGCKKCRVSWANMRWQHKTKSNQTKPIFRFIFHHFLANNNTTLHLSIMAYATRIVKNERTNERTKKRENKTMRNARNAGKGRDRETTRRYQNAMLVCVTYLLNLFLSTYSMSPQS